MAKEHMPVAKPGLVCVGRIVGACGLKGEVRIQSFTARPRDVAAYGPVRDETGRRAFTLAIVGAVKGQLIARVASIADRAAAEALKGMYLYVPRAALPPAGEGEYYHADLIGLTAELVDGRTLGTVTAVHDYGAGASLEVSLDRRGAEPVLVPLTSRVVPVIDVVHGRLAIDPPAGLLEPAGRPRNKGPRRG
jgi:16S rRNA processing protein RimM